MILARIDWPETCFDCLPIPIDLSLPPETVGMGLCRRGDGYIALTMTQPVDIGYSGWVELDERFAPVDSGTFRTVHQAHSIAPYRDGFIVNSSGTDSLVYVDFDGVEEPFWAHGDGRSHDVHVNSLAVVGESVYVTMLGPQTPDGWYNSSSGVVWNVTANEEVCGGLAHPHSLFFLEGRLCVLESLTGRVLDISTGNPREIAHVEGYASGAFVSGRRLNIGTSFCRLHSRHSPNSRHRTKIRSRCGISRIDPATGAVDRYELWRHSREIYDILVVDE